MWSQLQGNQVKFSIVGQLNFNLGDIIEKIYDSPMFNKVMPRQVDEIEIEIRTREGRLVPFQFGTTLIVLVFKKSIFF